MANGGVIGPPNTVTPATTTPVGDRITSITATGTFTIQCAPLGGCRPGSILVVAGGGGNGGDRPGGGGGGGARLLGCQTFGPAAIPVTIGAGGNNSSGSNTVFANPANPITVTGGGKAGGTNSAGTPGGSGGGGGGRVGGGGATPGGTGTACEGNPGVAGTAYPPSAYGGGGGGGSGAASGANGGNGISATPLFGSAPQPFYIANVPTNGNTACGTFAGGAAGGGCGPANAATCGGAGGGGDGFISNTPSCGVSGVTNSGGGGAGRYNSPTASGQGGSGIVLVKENATNVPVPAIAPGIWPMAQVYENVKSGDWTN